MQCSVQVQCTCGLSAECDPSVQCGLSVQRGLSDQCIALCGLSAQCGLRAQCVLRARCGFSARCGLTAQCGCLQLKQRVIARPLVNVTRSAVRIKALTPGVLSSACGASLVCAWPSGCTIYAATTTTTHHMHGVSIGRSLSYMSSHLVIASLIGSVIVKSR